MDAMVNPCDLSCVAGCTEDCAMRCSLAGGVCAAVAHEGSYQ